MLVVVVVAVVVAVVVVVVVVAGVVVVVAVRGSNINGFPLEQTSLSFGGFFLLGASRRDTDIYIYISFQYVPGILCLSFASGPRHLPRDFFRELGDVARALLVVCAL